MKSSFFTPAIGFMNQLTYPKKFALVAILFIVMLIVPFYELSGWPLVLESLADEAWRRSEAGLLADDELYCCDAQRAGMIHRNPHLAS